MPLSYYIKNRIINYGEYENLDHEKQKQIQELLDNIYTCCINGNIGKDEYHYKKIHKKTTYPITTDIKFIDIKNGKYSDFEIQNKISDIYGKKKGHLSHFLLYSYFTKKNSALIAFDDNDTIYTILTYYYNIEKDCIEVDGIWSDQSGGGGGIMMNFLINAIKCGISLCSNPSKYKRVLALYSIDDENTIGFYKKFSFIDNGQRKFTRELSVGSIDLNDEANVLKDLDEERDIFYRELEENENNIIKLNDKLQFLNKDLQYLSNTTTIREIETTKDEIKDLRERQIQILDKLTELEESHIKFMSKFYSLLENKEILDKITFTERDYKKLDFGKLIDTIKTPDNDDFLKLVKQYLNKNKNYVGMNIERVLTGVFYEIEEEKIIINNIKKLKKKKESILTGKEGSGGSRRTRRRRRNKSNKRNKSKRRIIEK